MLWSLGRAKNLLNNVVSSFIIVLEMFNWNLLGQISNSIKCEQINKNSYVSKDLSTSCDTKLFSFWVQINKFSNLIEFLFRKIISLFLYILFSDFSHL